MTVKAAKRTRRQVTDIRFENHGSICLIRPLTKAGREWIDQNVSYESWALFGGAVSCEPRYAGDIFEGAAADGLTVE